MIASRRRGLRIEISIVQHDLHKACCDIHCHRQAASSSPRFKDHAMYMPPGTESPAKSSCRPFVRPQAAWKFAVYRHLDAVPLSSRRHEANFGQVSRFPPV